MSETEQATRIITVFFLSLGFIYMIAKIIGEERKALWFKKRTKRSFFLRRGFLGETWNFGVPYRWEGVAVFSLMYGVIGIVGYFMIFVG